jgi:hypothetical protein
MNRASLAKKSHFIGWPGFAALWFAALLFVALLFTAPFSSARKFSYTSVAFFIHCRLGTMHYKTICGSTRRDRSGTRQSVAAQISFRAAIDRLVLPQIVLYRYGFVPPRLRLMPYRQNRPHVKGPVRQNLPARARKSQLKIDKKVAT